MSAIFSLHYQVRIAVLMILMPFMAVPGAQAEIVFSAKVLGPVSNIYAVDERGGDLHKVTDNIRWRDLGADVNVDGTIVFSSNRQPDPHIDLHRHAENFNLHVAEAGKPPRLFAGGPNQELMPKFSPGGHQVAYVERGGPQQRLMLTGGAAASRVLLEADAISGFSWSPDGKSLAVALRSGEASGLWRVSRSGGAVKFFEMPGEARVVSAQWSPDGDSIAFIRHPLDGPGRSLWVFEVESGEQKKISTDGQEVQKPVTWSEDGKKLLYAALVNYRFYYDEDRYKKVYRGSMQVYESEIGGRTRQVTTSAGLHRAPVYSPDGSSIAYLYAEHLAARRLALRVVDTGGGDMRELYPAVTQRSGLRWF